MRGFKAGPSSYSHYISAEIDTEIRNREKAPIVKRPVHRKKLICNICGEEVLTYVHAERHGFESKAQMINKGAAAWQV